MKRLAFIFSTAALLFGCSQIEEVNNPVQDDIIIEGDISEDLPKVIYASVSDEKESPETRTYVDGKQVKWHKGESISYYTGIKGNVKYTMKEEQNDGTAKAEFLVNGNAQYEYDLSPEFSLAVYPYHEDHRASYADGTYILSTTYADKQTYAPDSFGKGANVMVAVGESPDDTDLYFRNACGYLVIKLYGAMTRVETLTLTALGEGVKISGDATIRVAQGADFNIGMTDNSTNTVTLDCTNGGNGVILGGSESSATEFWFALPPITMEDGLQITITDSEGYTYTKQTTKDVHITRNEIQPMKAFAIGWTVPNDEIWYTQAEGVTTPTTFGTDQPFDVAFTQSYNADRGVFIIKFDNPVTVIKKDAFRNNQNILDVILPEGLETIEEYAFAGYDRYGQTSLRSINIPGTVTLVEDNVFLYNDSLKDITFEPSPTNTPLVFGWNTDSPSFGTTGAFWGTDLDRLEINRNFTSEHTPDLNVEGIFSGTTPNEIIFGEQFTEIQDYMFSYLDLGTLIVPNSVTEIGEYAFAYSRFAKIVIPKEVQSIGNSAFFHCYQLEEVVIEDSDQTLHIGHLDSYDAFTTMPEDYGPFYEGPLKTLYLGRNVVYSDDFTPDDNDEGMFSVNTSFWDGEGKNLTTTVEIGPLVTALKSRIFTGCPIESITLPGTLTTVWNNVFDGCKKLKSVTFSPTNIIDSETGKPKQLTVYFMQGANQKTIFYDAPIETVHIDRDIRYILEVNGSLDATNEGLFGDRATLRNVTFGSQAHTIIPYMFAGSGLTEITIPATVKNIGDDAFKDCKQLAKIIFSESATPITIGFQPAGILQNEVGPFYQSPLTYININREIVPSQAYRAARDSDDEGIFSSTLSTGTTQITLGGNVKTISDYMFSGVPVAKLWIPQEVETIGNYAFKNCSKLYGITLGHQTPPSLAANAFEDTILDSDESGRWIALMNQTALANFATATNWSAYSSIMAVSSPASN